MVSGGDFLNGNADSWDSLGWGTLLSRQLAWVLQEWGCITEQLGSVASEEDADALSEGQQDAPHHGQWATAGDGAPGVLLVPHLQQATVDDGEQSSH